MRSWTQPGPLSTAVTSLPKPARRRPQARLLPALAAGLGACLAALHAGCYSPKGGVMPSSTGAWTYVATETMSKTVTLTDLRTGEPIFVQTIPAGQQLTLQFLPGGGDDPVLRPDRMIYELQPKGTATGRLQNQMTVPPAAARRIDVDVTQEVRYAEPDESQLYRTDTPESRPDHWSPRGGARPDDRQPMYD